MQEEPDRRSFLLDRIVEALLSEGVADLSLRPLAERVGTSARLLIYHFESKEALVACALREVRSRIAESLKKRSAERQPASVKDMLLMFWEWALEEEPSRYFRLLFEVDGLSLFNRLWVSRETQEANTTSWLALIEGAIERRGGLESRTKGGSTLILASVVGLLWDYLSTGDQARTTSAFRRLVALIPVADAPPTLEEAP